MLELIVVLAIYTCIVLFFVPLERIGKVQTSVKRHISRLIDKSKS